MTNTDKADYSSFLRFMAEAGLLASLSAGVAVRIADALDARDQIISDQAQDIAQLQLNNAALHSELIAVRDEHAALDAKTDAGISQIELERDEAVRRADALERAVKSALDAWEADEFDEAKYYEIRAALYTQQEPDQPAQDGPMVMQPGEPSQRRCLVYCGDDRCTCEAGRVPKPDQPADADEPDTRPKCSHTRLVKDRCPVCGPLDDDNRPVTDGDKAAPDAAAAIRGEPSCCAWTREEERERCARQLEATAARLEQRAATAPTVALRTGLKADARMCRMNAAAIRRTGDTP
jgi:hypothetical protein